MSRSLLGNTGIFIIASDPIELVPVKGSALGAVLGFLLVNVVPQPFMAAL